MTSSNDNQGRGSRLGSLRELPLAIEPPRDLWPAIEARLDARTPVQARWPAARTALIGLAAAVASIAVGIWLGRDVLPLPERGRPQLASTAPPALVNAAFVQDPRYLQQRAALVRTLEAKLQELPPDSRAKVEASLATIRSSLQQITTALGRDPGNALLQELLVNTYADEMRVLTTVAETGASAEES